MVTIDRVSSSWPVWLLKVTRRLRYAFGVIKLADEQFGDGTAYGVTGWEGKCEFMLANYRWDAFEKLGAIKDEDGIPLWQYHHIVHAGDNTFYLCENDNPFRSAYLWELTL